MEPILISETTIALRERVRAVQEHGAYYRLILLVGGPRSGKTTELRALAAEQSWPMLNLNLQLSQRLLDTATKFRAIQTLDHVRQIVGVDGATPMVIDNIELLFQRDLQQDPLSVLLTAARSRTLVVSWPGDCVDGVLSYAVAGHPEHRRYTDPECAVVPIQTSNSSV